MQGKSQQRPYAEKAHLIFLKLISNCTKCYPSDRDWANGQKCSPCERGGLPCGPNVPFQWIFVAARLWPRLPAIARNCPHRRRHSSSSLPGRSIATNASLQSPVDRPQQRCRCFTSLGGVVRWPQHRLPGKSNSQQPNTRHRTEPLPELPFVIRKVRSPDLQTSYTGLSDADSLDHCRFKRLGLARIALENIRGVQRSIGPRIVTLDENKVQHDVEVTLDVMAYCVAKDYHTIVKELMEVAKETDTARAKGIYFEILDDINAIDKDKEKFSDVKMGLLQELVLIYEAEGNLPAVERTLKHMSTQKNHAGSDFTGDVAAHLAHCFVNISSQIRDLLHDLHLPIRPALHTDSGIHFPPLHRALRGDLDDVARLLGQKAAALKERDMLRQNAVIAAAATGKAALLDPIFRNNPQLLTDRDILERPALFHAAHHGDFDSYLTLVDAGANIYHRDPSSQSILGAAAAAGSTEIVRDLLDRGVPPNDDILHLSNPLHEAAKAGHREVVRLLLAKGAWANYWLNGKTAAQVASVNGFPAISAMIEEATLSKENDFYSCFPNSPADFQSTPVQRRTRLGSQPSSSSTFVPRSSPNPNAYGSPSIGSFASSQPSTHADQDYEVVSVPPNSTPYEALHRPGVQVVFTTARTIESGTDTDEAGEVY